MFGKLPTHGDFIARGLTAAEQAAWDDWLSAGLAQAWAALGSRFEALHGQAPPWRFVEPPGRFSREWSAGAVAPSVDKSGRRFMIMAGVAGAAPGREIAGAMEDMIYQAFEKGWDADALFRAVGALAMANAPGDQSTGWWTLGGADHAPSAATGCSDDLVLRMLTPTEAQA